MDESITQLYMEPDTEATNVAPLLAKQAPKTKGQKKEMTRVLNMDGRKWGTWG